VRCWTTLNGPWVSAFLGHATGQRAPGLQTRRRRCAPPTTPARPRARGRGHARQGDAGSTFGITPNLSPVDAASDDPADLGAARRADGLANRPFLGPLLGGGYPAGVQEDGRGVAAGGHVRSGDGEHLNAPLDLLGVNYYVRTVVRAGTAARDEPSVWVGSGDIEPVPRGLAQTEMAGRSTRRACDLLTRVAGDYPGVPL
jgi:beta-glucosidase